MNSTSIIDNLFKLFSIILVLAALHHLYEYFNPELRPNYPASRHIFFFVINLVLSIFVLVRNKYFLAVLTLVVAQQLYGHGGNLIIDLIESRKTLYTDWSVVILSPIMLMIYYYDIYLKNKDS